MATVPLRPLPISSFRVCHDITERSAAADKTEATLANEPTENADKNDPIEPIESTDPTEPIDRIEQPLHPADQPPGHVRRRRAQDVHAVQVPTDREERDPIGTDHFAGHLVRHVAGWRDWPPSRRWRTTRHTEGVGLFRFRTDWRVPANPRATYDTLADVARYPDWWPQVLRAQQLSADSGEIVCRSALPYSLRFVATRAIEDPERLQLRATLSGDLSGWTEWQIAPSSNGSIATFIEEVRTAGALKAASFIARPILEWNHTAMMRGGERGLRAYLASDR
jgi:hypothetical protein